MEHLEGRVAFITGGARGIGLGIARAMTAAGVRVAVADLDDTALQAAEAELGVQVHRLDVTDRTAYAHVAAHVQETLGEVSLLVNNAGVADSASPSRPSHELYDWMRSVNVDGVHNGLHAFLPSMVRRRDGHVLNTASEAGVLPGGSGFLYAATKYAVVGMSEALRDELAPLGIGVSVLMPGPVATTIVENTRARRPGAAPAHSARVEAILTTSHDWLLAEGRSPDDVGALVVDAVRANRPYVFTRAELAPTLQRRTDALVRAMENDTAFLDECARSRLLVDSTPSRAPGVPASKDRS